MTIYHLEVLKPGNMEEEKVNLWTGARQKALTEKQTDWGLFARITPLFHKV